MPDTTEKLEAAKKLVGTYCRQITNDRVYRIIDVTEDADFFTLLSVYKGFDGRLSLMSFPGWVRDDDFAPAFTQPISRAEYLAVTGPLFAELAEMAGISEGSHAPHDRPADET